MIRQVPQWKQGFLADRPRNHAGMSAQGHQLTVGLNGCPFRVDERLPENVLAPVHDHRVLAKSTPLAVLQTASTAANEQLVASYKPPPHVRPESAEGTRYRSRMRGRPRPGCAVTSIGGFGPDRSYVPDVLGDECFEAGAVAGKGQVDHLAVLGDRLVEQAGPGHRFEAVQPAAVA